jgi:phosphotransferase system enzyme I (PtsI)
MAGDPLMTLVLLGMGVRQLSMNPMSVPTIKRVIRGATASAAVELARRVMVFSTPEEVENELVRSANELFPEQKLSWDDLDDDTLA